MNRSHKIGILALALTFAGIAAFAKPGADNVPLNRLGKDVRISIEFLRPVTLLGPKASEHRGDAAHQAVFQYGGAFRLHDDVVKYQSQNFQHGKPYCTLTFLGKGRSVKNQDRTVIPGVKLNFIDEGASLPDRVTFMGEAVYDNGATGKNIGTSITELSCLGEAVTLDDLRDALGRETVRVRLIRGK